MGDPLHASDEELRDLAAGKPLLLDATRGEPTGLTLQRCLGVGGMSAVFLAELDPGSRSPRLSPRCPRLLAVKITKPSTERQLKRVGIDPASIYLREVAALGRVMERKPPTPFVVGLYGSGSVRVQLRGEPERVLPWLALEYVDGGPEGSTLSERVQRVPEGFDPGRVLRLVSGLLEGTRVLHEEGIVHRDLKPDNVFLSGPPDDEVPRLADCGIARVSGVDGGTLAAMTPAYGGPEQMLSVFRPGERNPLVGPWTDVHALAAVVWFLLAGEDWCLGEQDAPWHGGQRRSLLTARRRLHAGFLPHTGLIARLDRVLQRGAAHRLPAEVWKIHEGSEYERLARVRFAASMFSGPERPGRVEELARELLPLLEEFRALWVASGGGAGAPLRSTRLLPSSAGGAPYAGGEAGGAPYTCAEEEPWEGSPRLAAALLQPDGKVLARSGDRLWYRVRQRPREVAVPASWRGEVAAARWLAPGPGGGYALVGPRSVVLIRGGRFSSMPAPASAGKIVAVVAGGAGLRVLTEASGEPGSPGLWSPAGGGAWTPAELPIRWAPRAAAEGPDGLLVIGASPASPGSWVLHLPGPGGARSEEVSGAGGARVEEVPWLSAPPIALAVDPLGEVWVISAREVLLRREEEGRGVWRCLHRREASRPALLALGFSVEGIRVIDESGGGPRILPADGEGWRAGASTSLLLGVGEE